MAGAMGRQRCKHETNAARLVGGCCRGRLVGSLGMGADPNTSLGRAGKVAYLNFTQRSPRKQEVKVKTLHHVMILQQGGCRRQHSCRRLPKCQQDLLYQRLRALPEHLQYPVVGTSLDSRAPCRRHHQEAGEQHVCPWSANHRIAT